MPRTRAHASDSTHHLVSSQDQPEHSPPSDLPKLTKRERASWSQWVKARTDWRPADLRMLYQAVKLESEWFRLVRQARKVPDVCESANGGLYQHPIHALTKSAFKQYQDALKFLGLNTRPITNTPASARGASAGADRGKRGLLKSV